MIFAMRGYLANEFLCLRSDGLSSPETYFIAKYSSAYIYISKVYSVSFEFDCLTIYISNWIAPNCLASVNSDNFRYTRLIPYIYVHSKSLLSTAKIPKGELPLFVDYNSKNPCECDGLTIIVVALFFPFDYYVVFERRHRDWSGKLFLQNFFLYF